MVTIILIAILGLLIGIAVTDEWDRGSGIFFGLLFGVAAGFTVALFIGSFIHPQIERTDRSNLGNLSDNSSIEGHFFLGTGTVEGKMQYAYYKDIGNGEYKLRTLDADSSSYDVVVKQDSNKPYVETVGKETKGIWTAWYWLPQMYTLEHVTFHIPEGSISNDFNLDAK